MSGPSRRPGPGSLLTRLAWFAGLWLAGVLVLAAVALAIRSALFT